MIAFSFHVGFLNEVFQWTMNTAVQFVSSQCQEGMQVIGSSMVQVAGSTARQSVAGPTSGCSCNRRSLQASGTDRCQNLHV